MNIKKKILYLLILLFIFVNIYYVLEKDSIVYIPGKQSHGLRNSGKVPLEVIWIFPTDCWEDVKYVFDE